MRTATSLGIAGVAAVAMAATGAYAYHNIKQLNRYQTSDDVEKYQADYEKQYLKYEKLPQPSIAHVKLDVQLFPKQRRLIATGRYDLVNKTNAPIRDVHVRQRRPRHEVHAARAERRPARLRRQEVRLSDLPVRQAARAGRDRRR